MPRLLLTRSSNAQKKYDIIFLSPYDKIYKVSKISFGAEGYNDYTKLYKLNKFIAEQSKANYILRHINQENWSHSGMDSAGFWARWLLWNKPTIKESIKDIQKRFNVEIINKAT